MMESKTDDNAMVSASPAAGSVDQVDYIDPVIEKRTILKMDTVVLGCFGVMYLLANLDRNNLVCSSHHQSSHLTNLSATRATPTS
jgi:hypothetical protein